MEVPVHNGWLRPRRLLVLLDAISAVATLVCLRAFLQLKGIESGSALTSTFIAVGLLVIVVILLVFRDGQYSIGYRMSGFADLGNLTKNLLIGLGVAALLFYATKGFFTGYAPPSRLVLAETVVVFFVLAAGSRFSLAAYQRSQFLKGKGVEKVLVLGAGKASEDLRARIEQRPWMGVRYAGSLAYGVPVPETGPSDVVWLTNDLEGLESLDRAMRVSGASTVLIALDEDEHAVIPHISRLLSLAHVPYRIMPSLFEPVYAASSRLGNVDLPTVLTLRIDPLDRAQLACKRMLDVILATCLMVVILPLTASLALIIKIDSRGPVFYKQERVGRNGCRFHMFKFRTMVADADALLDQLAAENEVAEDGGRLFKIRDDPRITRVGRFLRKSSLDELPQVFNVYRGEMSLVGPRPPLPREVQNYEIHHFCRLKGMPGITGLWQVSGRSELSFEEMVRLDQYYLENWSLALDIAILLKTVSVVLTRKGAY